MTRVAVREVTDHEVRYFWENGWAKLPRSEHVGRSMHRRHLDRARPAA